MCNVRGRLRVVSSYPKSHRHPWTDCGARRRVNHFCLDALDLIEADLVAPAVVELRRALRGVVRHRRGLSSVPPFLNISRDRSSGPAVRLSVEHVGTAAPTKPCRAERIAVRAWPPARRTPVPKDNRWEEERCQIYFRRLTRQAGKRAPYPGLRATSTRVSPHQGARAPGGGWP